MIKKGISGGILNINSLISASDRTALANTSMIRTSSSLREAAKVGLQSLYADADAVLEKYKDFDIIKEMNARNGANLLWVRARAIDADVVNANGDYFSEEELTKEVDYQGKKMPAYKTFEGVPIYTNHKNDNIEEAKGMVVYAEWDDEEKCVYCVFFIDEDAYPEIGRGIRQGYIKDVSMGCFDGNTKIPTSNGFKKIIDVTDNDHLFDAEGNLVKIINRQEYDHFDTIHLITLEGGHQIKCTDYHPYLVFTKDQWNGRKSLKRPKDANGKKTSKWIHNDITPEYIRLENLKPGDMLLSPIGGNITSDSNFTVNKAKIIGYFLAEGSYRGHKNSNTIFFTFNFSEKDSYAQEVVDLIREEFGVEAKIFVPKEKNYCRISVTNETLKNWLFENCGRWSSKKKLHPRWLTAPYEIQKSIIGAWIDGDGCTTVDKRNNNTYLRVCTTSIDLFDQMSFILTRLGIYHSCYFAYSSKRFDYIDLESFEDFHPQCIIQIPSYATCELEGFLHKHVNASTLNKDKHTYKNFLARKIISIQEIPIKQQKVYTFQTESGNYLAHNFISKNCSVEKGVCSICGNEATTERDYCQCLKQYKGKMHPSGKRTFEYNFGIKFIELSCVGDGAFESCEIMELYDQDELLQKAERTIKSAQALNSSIILAASYNDKGNSRKEVESALRQLQSLNSNFIKVAQTAGTLVGGQLMGGGNAQSATVTKILQGLGIDPTGNLNILDLINLALNFLEVAVLNLFSRKENIDLSHVAKLTKAMGELQNTLQDMIDDGIETSKQIAGQQVVPPMAPAQPAGAAPQAPAAPAQPPITQPAFLEQPAIGQMVSPFSQQPYLMPLGGGVSASADNTRFVWASTNEELSTQKSIKENNFTRFAIALNNLKEACGIITNNNEGIINNPSNNKIQASTGDIKIMDHFKKIAQDLKKQNTVAVAIDIKLDDQSGNRVVLSTDKGIKGYHNGRLTNWSPTLSDSQIAQMESGDGYRVASELLKDFSSVIKTAQKDHQVDALIVLDDSLDCERTEENVQISFEVNNASKNKTHGTLQEKLDARRMNSEINEVTESLLEGQHEHKLVRIVTELAKDAKGVVGDKPLSELLNPNLGHSEVPGKLIMSNLVNSIVRTCSATSKSPEDVINFLVSVSSGDNFARILRLARVGTKTREYNNLMTKMAQVEDEMKALPAPDMEEEAIKNIADTAEEDTTEAEIISALNVIKDNFATAVEKITEVLEKVAPQEKTKEDEMEEALVEDEPELDTEAMNGAVTGLSLAGEEMGANPDQMVDAVNEMPADFMADQVNKIRAASNKISRTASKTSIHSTIVQWLADVANEKNIATDKIVLAAKLFCSHNKAAENVLAKSMRTAEVKVIDETTHATTIYATLEDIQADIKDAAFNQKFRDFAVELLSNSGYEIDRNTFALTEINVDESGMVCGKVSTRATKTFKPEINKEENTPFQDEDMLEKMIEPVGAVVEPSRPISFDEVLGMEATMGAPKPQAGSIVMSDSVKSMKKIARLKQLVKIAQGLGLPGAPGAPAAPADPAAALGTPAPAADPMAGLGDMGLGSLTGASPEAEATPGIDESPEPGNVSPWGTICPQCGSKDVDIANGEGQCNSCNAQLKYRFIVEVAPPEKEGAATPVEEEAELPATPPVGGIGGAEAGMATQPNAMAAPAPAAPGMAMAKSRVMTRVSYKTTADVYAEALQEDFNKMAAHKLPVGLVCPACGSKTASRNSRKTYCYDCNTLSVSEVKKVEGEPGVLEANIVWINEG